MPVNIGSAIGAYTKTGLDSSGLEPRKSQDPGSDFLNLVKEAAESAVETGKKGEEASMRAVAGNADISEVVTAVANAEITLQTAVAIRDKVIAAYQDIARMPL